MSKKNSNVLNLKDFFKKQKKILRIYTLFKEKLSQYKKKNLVAAISGGPDSLALAALLKTLQYEKGIKVYYVLIDHGIRKESEKESKKVKLLLKKQKINLKILKNKTLIKKNVQKLARDIRYKLLTNFCIKNKVKYILTAHHRDDQVETFLIRLSRGSGVQGLSAMDSVSTIYKKIKILRPLLDDKKEDLIHTSNLVFGKYLKDPSNKDQKYLRTKVRNLKKLLEKNGLSYDQILKSIKNLSATRDTLNNYIFKLYNKSVFLKKNKAYVNYSHISNESEEVQLKLLGKVLKNYTKSYYPPRSKKILNLIHKIRAKKIKNLHLSGCMIKKLGKNIIISK